VRQYPVLSWWKCPTGRFGALALAPLLGSAAGTSEVRTSFLRLAPQPSSLLRPISSPRSPSSGRLGIWEGAFSVPHTDPHSSSTPWVSGSSAACFTHSSAFSLPSTSSCAGHHLTSMHISGLATLSPAIHSLAITAYFCPGPGSANTLCVDDDDEDSLIVCGPIGS